MKSIICLGIVIFIFGCMPSEKSDNKVTVEFRFAETEPGQDLRRYSMPQTGQTFYLHKEVVMSNNDIAEAVVDEWQGKPVVRVNLTTDGKGKLAELTRNNLNRHIAILINGNLITAPRINAPITQGVAMINGDFTSDEAQRICDGITPKKKNE